MKRVIGLGSAAASPSDRFAPHATAALRRKGDLHELEPLDLPQRAAHPR
jgi:hypothetical protein